MKQKDFLSVSVLNCNGECHNNANPGNEEGTNPFIPQL